MRYAASEKLAIIRLVEGSSLPVRRTLERMGIPRATFYRWYDLYCSAGPEALEDHCPRPDRVWNRIPEDVRDRIVKLALDEPALSPRELAVRFSLHHNALVVQLFDCFALDLQRIATRIEAVRHRWLVVRDDVCSLSGCHNLQPLHLRNGIAWLLRDFRYGQASRAADHR